MATTFKLLILAAFVIPVILSCDKPVPDSASLVPQTAEGVAPAKDAAPRDETIGADVALQQWEQCITRSCFEKPSMFSLLAYSRTNVSRPELETILTDRFLRNCKKGILSLSSADLYQIASGAVFNVATPSEPAAGSSYFTDSSAVLFLTPGFSQNIVYFKSKWRYPLQDFCSHFSDSTPTVSFGSTYKNFEATYGTPVPITYFNDTGAATNEIKTVRWSLFASGEVEVSNSNPLALEPQHIICMLLSKTPIRTDSVAVTKQSWCAWSIDIDNDSIADLRTITVGDTVTNKGTFDIFAQININGNWVTTDYRLGCVTEVWVEFSATQHNYTHKEWDIWDTYSFGMREYK